jgi:hypothetical protein
MDSELIPYIVAIAVSFGVGLPILRKGFATRDTPAILLGAALLFDAFEWLCWALCAFTPAYGTPLGDGFAIACRLGITASVICMLLFTRIAFRPESRAATAWVWLLSGTMLFAFVASGTVGGDWGGWSNDHPWTWVEWSAQVGSYGWTAVEPLAYYVRMKRRARHEAVDPVVTNRLLLWGVYAGMFCLSQAIYGGTLAFFEDLTTLDPYIAAMGIFGEVALWFAFFPPATYLRWLRAGQPAAG